MGLFGIFSGKSPEEHEQRGDNHVEAGAYGDARIEYEKALHKIERKFPEKAPLAERIRQKFRRAGDLLARDHVENADVLANAGDYPEALELFRLAMDLAEEDELKEAISEKMQQMAGRRERAAQTAPPAPRQPQEEADWFDAEPEDSAETVMPDMPEDGSDEELFTVLCHALPEAIEAAYRSYGEAFTQGYVALNQGRFETAAELLARSLEENVRPNLIGLELATAHLHLKDYDYARELLEAFLDEHPEDVRAYQLLCEIYWDTGRYEAADRLLASCPAGIRENPAILLLTGETRFQEKAYDAAEAEFNRYIAINGKDEVVSRALAKTMEAQGDLKSARELYAQIINQCTSCQTRVDPFLKRRYAELSFETGDDSTKLLDLYLALTREDPENRPVYYRRIASIYEKRGDIREAQRYAAFGSEAE